VVESLNDAKFCTLQIENKAPKIAVEGSLHVHNKTKRRVSHLENKTLLLSWIDERRTKT